MIATRNSIHLIVTNKSQYMALSNSVIYAMVGFIILLCVLFVLNYIGNNALESTPVPRGAYVFGRKTNSSSSSSSSTSTTTDSEQTLELKDGLFFEDDLAHPLDQITIFDANIRQQI